MSVTIKEVKRESFPETRLIGKKYENGLVLCQDLAQNKMRSSAS